MNKTAIGVKLPVTTRKLGHLYQAVIHLSDRDIYGYGITRARATEQAKCRAIKRKENKFQFKKEAP